MNLKNLIIGSLAALTFVSDVPKIYGDEEKMPNLEGLIPITTTYLSCDMDSTPKIKVNSYYDFKNPLGFSFRLSRKNKKNPYMIIGGDLTMYLDNGMKRGFVEDGTLDEKRKIENLSENLCHYVPKTFDI